MSNQRFRPHPLIRGGFWQTVAAHYANTPETPYIPDHTIVVDLEDEDKIAVDLNGELKDDGKPVVFMAHGLGGCSNSSYKVRISQKLNPLGFKTARFNHRGCGNHNIIAHGIYHSGSTRDLLRGIVETQKFWPSSPIMVIGFSLSGTILLNMLSEDFCPDFPNIKKFLAVCCPLDLERSSQQLEKGSTKAFDKFYAHHMRLGVDARVKRHPHLEVPQLPKRFTLREFDEIYTAREAGFNNRADYYHKCSPIFKLDRLKRKVEVLLSKDDPLVPQDSWQPLQNDPRVTLNIQKSGGHLGFIAARKTVFKDFRWLDEYIWRSLADL